MSDDPQKKRAISLLPPIHAHRSEQTFFVCEIVLSLTLPISTYQPFTADSGNILAKCCKPVFAFDCINKFSLGIFK